MLESEGSFSMGGRHSSIDSNRASSGDISPYDNNSPVLSERSLLTMQEDMALSSDKLFKVPEQRLLVSSLQPKSRENSLGSWFGKDDSEDYFNIWGAWHSTLKSGSKDPGMAGSYGDIYESSSLRPGQCSLSQGNLSLPSPQWQGSTTELDNVKQIIRRSQTTAALPECRPHPPLSRVCSTPQIELGRKHSSQSNSEQHFTASSTEHLAKHDLDTSCLHSAAKPLHLRQSEVVRKDRPPPPPYPDTTRLSSTPSHRPAVSSTEHPLWRLQRAESRTGTIGGGRAMAQVPEHSTLWEDQQNKMGRKCSTPDKEQNNKNLSEPDWHDWQRDRWQIWEILSPDNPDALPETLV